MFTRRLFTTTFVLLIVSGALLAALTVSAQSGFGTGWTVQYFNNNALSGTPILTETLPGGINFTWGTGSPNPAVPADNFSARYTSVQNLQAGTYEFVVSSDDGVRVFIDNVLVLDRFFARVLTTDRFTLNLTAGAHTFTVEYVEYTDQAALSFQWFLTSVGGTPGVPGGGILPPGVTPTFGPTPTATRIPPTPLPEIPPGALTGTVIRATVLLARQQPFFAAPVVARLQRGQTYQVIGRDPDARWFLLQLSSTQAWVWGYYLFVNGNEFNAPVVSSFVTSGGAAAGTQVVAQTQAILRLRAAPTTASQQIGRIPWGDIVPVIGRTSDGIWYQVVFRGTTGWIASEFVRIVEGDPGTIPVVQ
ncbi:MAG: SH3 domain-containing protein [Candidatus Flexifilum sp.]